MGETEISRAIREAMALRGVAMTRNNVGRLQDAKGRWVTYGLGVGSADLIGCAPVHCVLDSGPVILGRYCALEVKSESGRLRPEQVAWATAVRKSGGFVAVVRSVDEAMAAYERCLCGAVE